MVVDSILLEVSPFLRLFTLSSLQAHLPWKHIQLTRLSCTGLSVHMNQVHKESLSSVENALPNRQGLEVEIFGMEGVPEDIVQQHNQRIIQNYYQAQAERHAATGNPPPGQGQGSAKKIKVESKDDLKKRLAEHRARLAAQKAAGGANGSHGNTPRDTQSPGQSASPGAFVSCLVYYRISCDANQHRTHPSVHPRNPASIIPRDMASRACPPKISLRTTPRMVLPRQEASTPPCLPDRPAYPPLPAYHSDLATRATTTPEQVRRVSPVAHLLLMSLLLVQLAPAMILTS